MSKIVITTTGDLRTFLVNMMTGIRDGRIDTEKAGAIIKAAQQINESFYSEIKTRQVQRAFGSKAHELGQLPIGHDVNLGDNPGEGAALPAPETDLE